MIIDCNIEDKDSEQAKESPRLWERDGYLFHRSVKHEYLIVS